MMKVLLLLLRWVGILFGLLLIIASLKLIFFRDGSPGNWEVATIVRSSAVGLLLLFLGFLYVAPNRLLVARRWIAISCLVVNGIIIAVFSLSLVGLFVAVICSDLPQTTYPMGKAVATLQIQTLVTPLVLSSPISFVLVFIAKVRSGRKCYRPN
jgi:hypothetical protein